MTEKHWTAETWEKIQRAQAGDKEASRAMWLSDEEYEEARLAADQAERLQDLRDAEEMRELAQSL